MNLQDYDYHAARVAEHEREMDKNFAEADLADERIEGYISDNWWDSEVDARLKEEFVINLLDMGEWDLIFSLLFDPINDRTLELRTQTMVRLHDWKEACLRKEAENKFL